MKKWNLLRLTGLMVAVALVVFGSVENLLRTVRYGLERIGRN